MMDAEQLLQSIQNGELDEQFLLLYGTPEGQRERYCDCVRQHRAIYGDKSEVMLFSTPGRTEIGGNHTDHQRGRVLAGAISLDVIAAVSINDQNVIRVLSKGYPADMIDLCDLRPKEREKNRSAALIRGVAAQMRKMGCPIGGFDAYTTSNVLAGSGLSSSAAFEVLIATIFNSLFCEDELSPVQLAMISQYAENEYFGKPSGLLDQTACAAGDCIEIDFQDPQNPIGNRIDFDLGAFGYRLVIVSCGGNHAYLTDDYASVPADMRTVAKYFGKEVLRELNVEEFYDQLFAVRKICGDRACLRAAHFFDENERVPKMREAIVERDIDRFFTLVDESGRSSYELLQNIYSDKNPREQGLAIALCLAKRILGGTGACRVHGGGFAGTIQAYVKTDLLDDFVAQMEKVFGEGSCYILHIRKPGCTKIL